MKMVCKYSSDENSLSVRMELEIDGSGVCDIDTGENFLDKMLTRMASDAQLDLTVSTNKKATCLEKKLYRGIGTAFGSLLKEHYGRFDGRELIGSSTDIIHDALITCAVNLAGRTHLNYALDFTVPNIENISVDSIYEFYYSVVAASGISLHFIEHCGAKRVDNYHLAETSFFSFGKAVKNAFSDAV